MPLGCRCRPACLVLAAAILLGVSVLQAAEPTSDDAQFFENKVRPLLVRSCQKCHGPEKQKSDLRLDSLGAALAGGESGPALVPGKPGESLLIQAIKYEGLEMPPDAKLPSEDVAILIEWVRRGAPWPGSEPQALAPRKHGTELTAEDRQFWSFQPIRRQDVPALAKTDVATNDIDAFIRSALAEREITPAGPATRRELIRRVTFDLLGLPPTPEQVAAFEADSAPDAYEKLIDHLLQQPQYGERWGRHWLDIVRFAQTNGYERDDEKPHAWRYRDYVIKSFNEDKPYDRFILEQLAGDELEPVTDDSLTATAFYRLSVWDDEPDDGRQAEFDGLDDIVSTTGTTFLGLTIGCARCHDHKFDPIPQVDYYSLLSFVRNVRPYSKPDKDADKTIFAKLQSGEETLVVHEYPHAPPKTQVLVRGNAATPAQDVEPRFLQVLTDVLPKLPEKAANGQTSGRRRVLAEWIASPQNPLTARVMANRLWHYHFGRGIVPTPSDFGHTGLAPTNPPLLDYLASELIAGGWKLKALHKRIMLSATYQQSARADNLRGIEIDPDNTLLWRQNLRRLEAEAIRDAMLAVSGQLNPQMGGRGIFPQLPSEVLSTQSRPGNGWGSSNPQEQARRSVYIFIKRTLGVPMLESFDAASPDSSTAARATTTIAPQALIMLNSEFMDQQAREFARRLMKEAGREPTQDVTRAFQLAVGRNPSPAELSTALAYIARQQKEWPQVLAAGPPKNATTQVKLAGWSYYGGDWSLRDDGGYQVEPSPGAKAIWNDPLLADGTVECEVCLLSGGDAGLVLRVTDPRDGVDALTAYNINFAPNRLRLGKHQNNWRELKGVPIDLPVEVWKKVRVQLTGNRIQITVGEADQPQLDYEDPEPLPAGRVGFRTFQMKSAFRQLKLQTGDKAWVAELNPAQLPPEAAENVAYERALASFCKLVLNLNEFVYID